MSKSIVLDKLNLNPLTSDYTFNKGDIGANPTISVFNYSNNIPPQFEGEPINLLNPVRGNNPYSAQKFYSKRVVNDSGGQIIFAKIPFVNGEDSFFIKPYRSGFTCKIYFQYTKSADNISSLIVNLDGSFPTTLTGNPLVQTTKTNLEAFLETGGDFEVTYIPNDPDLDVFEFLSNPLSSAKFFVGRNPSFIPFTDSTVDTTSDEYIYIGANVFLTGGSGTSMIIKTIFNYI